MLGFVPRRQPTQFQFVSVRRGCPKTGLISVTCLWGLEWRFAEVRQNNAMNSPVLDIKTDMQSVGQEARAASRLTAEGASLFRPTAW